MLSDELWITTLQTFLSVSELSVCIPGLNPISLQRDGDFVLMDAVQLLQFSKRDIISINRCRIFLRVNTASDICNAAGTEINLHVYHCDPSVRRDSFLNWPRQELPGKSAQRIWQQFLRSLCHDSNMRLRVPMGNWFTMERSRLWDGYYIQKRDIVLTFDTTNQLLQYNRIIRQRKTWELQEPSSADLGWRSLITEGTPIDVISQDNSHCSISVPKYSSANTPLLPKTWDEYVSALPAWARGILQSPDFRSKRRECSG
jgi:hypothetical protein